MPIASGSRLGRYEILARLGAGGMGEVWRARDSRLGRDVAIKILPQSVAADDERLKRFEREARAASSLSHPNIVTVYEVARIEETSLIVMELVGGRTLGTLIAVSPLSIKRLLQLAPQIADGLARAHASGIVHRDLKPENVMVTDDGHVKILDFGLAKLTNPGAESEETAATTVTRPGIAVGTASYMSPEQAAGLPVDYRSDQFAFGSILYEMAAGRAAFRHATTVQTLAAIIEEEPEPLARLAPRTPAPLRWVIERCLAKDPKARYASTEDLARELADLRDHLPELSSASEVRIESPHRRIRRWLPAALAILGAGTIAWTLLRPVRETIPRYHRVSFRRGAINGARFAPDGQTIVFGGAWEGNPSQLSLTRTDSTESSVLPLPSANILSISSTGKMAIVLLRGPQTLAEVSLAGGAPREILEDPVWVSADWAPDGRDLAIARNGGLEFPIGKVLYKGSLYGPTGPRVSPDGKSIAFVEGGIYEEQAIALVNLAGKKSVLRRGLEYTLGLAWNPQTNEVWFSAREHSGGDYGGLVLFAVSPSGRYRVVNRVPESLIVCDISRDGRVLLTHSDFRKSMMYQGAGAARESDLTWLDFSQAADLSDDGTSILFDEAGAMSGRMAGVYLRKTDGSPAIRLGEGTAAALSPDGKWAIAFPPEHDRLRILPTGAGEPRTLRFGGLAYAGAKWFPDGKRVLFSASAPHGGSRLYVQDTTDGDPHPLTPEGYDIGPVSPDGRLVAARTADGKVQLFPVDGGPSRPVEGVEPDDTVVRWDSTGDTLFLSRGVMPLKIDRLFVSTGRREAWKEIIPIDPSGIIESTVRLTPDGRSYAYSFLRDTDYLYVVDGLR